MYSLYLLVEGKSTEPQLYPNWLTWLLPGFSRVDTPDAAGDHNFFLISGEGYPRLLTETLPDAIADVNDNPQYRYLLICLDADELTVTERKAEVQEYLDEHSLKHAEARIIVQNRCIETWLLGNTTIYPNNPQHDKDCIRFCQHYNVSNNDPELMPIHPSYRLHAKFHGNYLRAVFRERNPNVIYKKNNPGQAKEQHYFNALLRRLQNTPHHLQSFAEFVDLCNRIPRPQPPEAVA